MLWKHDKELGIAYFCTICKTFVCDGRQNCQHCGQALEWRRSGTEYKGKVYWEKKGGNHEKGYL